MHRSIGGSDCACPLDSPLKCGSDWFDSGWECPHNYRAYAWLARIGPYKLSCRNCRWHPFQWHQSADDVVGIPYVINPANGWWEPARVDPECGCRYYDSRGFALAYDELFFIKDHVPGFERRLLRIDDIYGDGIVRCFDPIDNWENDKGPTLRVTDVVAISPLITSVARRWRWFRKDSVTARWRRGGSCLAHFLHFRTVHRFHCCSREIWHAVIQGRCDAVWARACRSNNF